jgi:hypothetical protein
VIVRLAQYGEGPRSAKPGWLTLGAEYVVVTLRFAKNGQAALIEVVPDEGGVQLASVDLGDFEVIDGRASASWLLTEDESGWSLAPESWSEPGIWDDYFMDNVEPRPLASIGAGSQAAAHLIASQIAEMHAEAGRQWPNAPALSHPTHIPER